MTDDLPVTTRQAVPAPQALPFEAKLMPLIGWASYLFGFGIVGLIIAYIDRGNAPGLVADNYTYMIRTFWIVLAYWLLALALAAATFALHVAVAWLAFFALGGLVGIWFLARCIKGLIFLLRDLPMRNPRTWLV